MIEAVGQINAWAVLAAIVASFIFGGLWFGVAVAKVYPIALGREALAPQKPSPWGLGSRFRFQPNTAKG